MAQHVQPLSLNEGIGPLRAQPASSNDRDAPSRIPLDAASESAASRSAAFAASLGNHAHDWSHGSHGCRILCHFRASFTAFNTPTDAASYAAPHLRPSSATLLLALTRLTGPSRAASYLQHLALLRKAPACVPSSESARGRGRLHTLRKACTASQAFLTLLKESRSDMAAVCHWSREGGS